MAGAVADPAVVELVQRTPGVPVVVRPITPKRLKAALEVLERTGNLSLAADAVGIARRALYRRLEDDPDLAQQFADARERATDRLEQSVRSRAETGTTKGVWYKGERVGEEIETHDVLAMFLLKAARPDQYRETAAATTINVAVAGPSRLTDQELEAVVAAQLRHDRIMSSETFNDIKQLARDSSLLHKRTIEASDDDQREIRDLEGTHAENGGAGVARRAGRKGTQHRQRRTKVSKTSK